MSFSEVNILGVYIAPISVMIVAAWLLMIPVRRATARAGLLRHVWHPALFGFAIYLIVLSVIVLLVSRWHA
jgi:hypothetical protein